MKLLHVADLHLDAPFAALSAEKAALRRAEGRALLERLAALAREEEVDLVVIAGDLFDGKRVYRETLTAIAQTLASIPVPVLIAPGNHDPRVPGSPYETMEWPENVTIFRGEELEQVEFAELNCTVHGTAFTGPRKTRETLAGFSVPDDGQIHIGLMHGDVGANSQYHPISLQSIADSGLDYLALGHVHAGSGLQKTGDTFWAYPGCAQGRGFDELGEKGCLIVEVEPGAVSARFCPLANRKYVEVEVDITTKEPLEAASEALAQQAPEDCVKLIFVGEREERPNLAALERKLAGKVFALRLRDHTRPKSDLWEKAEEDTLTGAFLRLMKEQVEQGDETAALAADFGLAALEQGEDCRP